MSVPETVEELLGLVEQVAELVDNFVFVLLDLGDDSHSRVVIWLRGIFIQRVARVKVILVAATQRGKWISLHQLP